MRLLARLESEAASAESYFRKVLAREDIDRLTELRRLAHEHATVDQFKRHALFIGWTKDDLRTHELKEQLYPVMEAIFSIEKAGAAADAERELDRAWDVFNAHRLKVLVHCL